MAADRTTEGAGARPGTAGISEALRQFVAELPWEREAILDFVMRAAAATPAGATVLDVGAGDAPYAELFAHTDYRTTDWQASPHEGARDVSFVAPADALPLDDGALDVVLSTQVLEHVADPAAVLAEARRVLRPGGTLYVTVPFVWELHELPHDYYRFTAHGLEHLLRAAGFADVTIDARGDSFTTLAQLTHNVAWNLGAADDGQDARRAQARAALEALSQQLAALAPLDATRVLPLGYQARAVRP